MEPKAQEAKSPDRAPERAARDQELKRAARDQELKRTARDQELKRAARDQAVACAAGNHAVEPAAQKQAAERAARDHVIAIRIARGVNGAASDGAANRHILALGNILRPAQGVCDGAPWTPPGDTARPPDYTKYAGTRALILQKAEGPYAKARRLLNAALLTRDAPPTKPSPLLALKGPPPQRG